MPFYVLYITNKIAGHYDGCVIQVMLEMRLGYSVAVVISTLHSCLKVLLKGFKLKLYAFLKDESLLM